MNPSLRQVKRALRRQFRQRILDLDPEQRRREEDILRAGLVRLPGYQQAATLLLYVSAFPEEIDTWPLIRDALEAGRRLVLPRVDRDAGGLVLHEIVDLRSDLAPGVLDIPEPRADRPIVPPDEVRWALVPGLGFDQRGYRLGRGAGHYDRLLPRLPAHTPRWAIALSPQWVEELPVEPHDQRLNGILGAARIYDDSADYSGFPANSG